MDEESWETVWPPECIEDRVLIEAMIGFLSKQTGEYRELVWNQIIECADKFGIQENSSLLQDLYTKSGKVSRPFIDLAVAAISRHVGSRRIASLLGAVLLKQNLETVEMILYQACVWELFASLVCVLMHNNDCCEELPASCYAPTDRIVYIQKFFKNEENFKFN